MASPGNLQPVAGNDTITDFGTGNDKIVVSPFSAINGLSDIVAKQEGDDVVLDFTAHGGGTITLQNFDLDDLDANDFVFADTDGA